MAKFSPWTNNRAWDVWEYNKVVYKFRVYFFCCVCAYASDTNERKKHNRITTKNWMILCASREWNWSWAIHTHSTDISPSGQLFIILYFLVAAVISPLFATNLISSTWNRCVCTHTHILHLPSSSNGCCYPRFQFYYFFLLILSLCVISI